jgi:hypothetical protein
MPTGTGAGIVKKAETTAVEYNPFQWTFTTRTLGEEGDRFVESQWSEEDGPILEMLLKEFCGPGSQIISVSKETLIGFLNMLHCIWAHRYYRRGREDAQIDFK